MRDQSARGNGRKVKEGRKEGEKSEKREKRRRRKIVPCSQTRIAL